MERGNDKVRIYIGTYTRGDSKGIYTLNLNYSSGKLEELKVAGKADNPTYIALDSINRILYSVTKEGDNGGVASYSIDKESGDLKFINSRISPGAPPCHVSIDNTKKWLFSANYHMGVVKVFPLNTDGSIGEPTSEKFHTGSGPNKSKQEKPHAHYIELTPDGKNLFVADLGIDKIVSYSLKDGILGNFPDSSLIIPGGSGPRHFAFHPVLNCMYLLSELSSEVFVIEICRMDNSLRLVQKVSALPADFKGESSGAAIHLSTDGRFLYTSNRGHDSITTFSIDVDSGKVKLIDITSCGGAHPRDFELDPQGKFAVVANMNTNNLTLFSRNASTGRLTRLEQEISVPSPVCVKFLF